jgi:hypothetical protein
VTLMRKEGGTESAGREEGQHWVTEGVERGGDMEIEGGRGRERESLRKCGLCLEFRC